MLYVFSLVIPASHQSCGCLSRAIAKFKGDKSKKRVVIVHLDKAQNSPLLGCSGKPGFPYDPKIVSVGPHHTSSNCLLFYGIAWILVIA